VQDSWPTFHRLLFNLYGVIAVNPAKKAQINAGLANAFIDWLIAVPTQEEIAGFGKDRFGQPLFYPDSALYHAAHSGAQQHQSSG